MDRQVAHPNWIEIDLDQFKKNIAIIRSAIGESKYCLPVKANAYGHGLIPIAQAAVSAGVDYLSVAHVSEAVQLRQAGISIPIFVMGAIHQEQIQDLLDYDLEISVSSIFKAELLSKICKEQGRTCKVHLEIDTGMQRTGVRPSSAINLLEVVKSLGCFVIKGVYSHLATADKPHDLFAKQQIKEFKALLSTELFSSLECIAHIANSGGVQFYPESYLSMVRPSLLSFGYKHPDSPVCFEGIKPCFSLKSKISYFKVVQKGHGISYGHTYITEKDTRIVTVPIGYGDGLRRSLAGKLFCLIRGKKFPVVGAICMDQCMVDVGDHEVFVGDEVVFIGKQHQQTIHAAEMADACNTIVYEIFCLFNERIPRTYK
ncbi:MAG: alanine racemase [Chlamydiae bacterium]|nr:alanine racemase [Chlamydiota bacterium]